MNKNFIFSIVFFALLLVGCTTKGPITNSYPVNVVILSPALKITGSGFYRQGSNHLNVQLYSAGSFVLNLEIKNLICVNDQCVFKETFNKNFFLSRHYNTFLEDILSAKPIYEKENLIKNSDGFSQYIYKKNSYDITYEVDNKNVVFKDIKNNISIKITKLGN